MLLLQIDHTSRGSKQETLATCYSTSLTIVLEEFTAPLDGAFGGSWSAVLALDLDMVALRTVAMAPQS